MEAKTTIYQSKQIRAIEQTVISAGLSLQDMMQRAGLAAFNQLLKHWPTANTITVFCGCGNNGGDGYILATLAHEAGLKVTVWQVGDESKMQGYALQAKNEYEKTGSSLHKFTMEAVLDKADVIVDAILGIGLHGKLSNEVKGAITKINAMQSQVLAIDVPTGVNADTGYVQEHAIYATVTLTFIGLKLGLLTGAGCAYAGKVLVDDLQLPVRVEDNISPVAEEIRLSMFATYLKPRTKDWHKGLSGHVLIVGGDKGLSGAVRMAGSAALRVGAGLVSVATHTDHAALVNSQYPEIMSHGITHAKDLDPLLKKASLIVLGPGLGQSAWSKEVWSYVITQPHPMIVDADGLNLLAQYPQQRTNWILTPHPAEAARLLKDTNASLVQEDRLSAINRIHQQFNGVCVLKGAGSLVKGEDLPGLCRYGNPGMATAGMGDILSGVLGGLWAQNSNASIENIAKLGVAMHALAGDLAAEQGERGMVATDLLLYLRYLCNPIHEAHP